MHFGKEVTRKKTVLTGIVYGAVYALLYRAPIVVINVIISGGSRNGPSMVVSSVLCALFVIAMAVRTAKKKRESNR